MSFTDSFKQLESSFNSRYLMVLFQLTDIVDPSKDPDGNAYDFTEEDREQLVILEDCCARWRNAILQDPMRTDTCDYAYQAVGDHVNLLQARDERLLADHVNGADFFAHFFDTKGIKTMFLYNKLCDSVEADDKGNLWEAILSLYRLAVLVNIFKQTPVVRDIIAILFENNPDMTAANVFETVVREFKKKKELRSIISDIIRTHSEEKFTEIISNLQKVVATFGTPPPTPDRENAQAQRLEICLGLSELQHLDQEARDQLGKILSAERGAHVDASTPNKEYDAVVAKLVKAQMGLEEQFVVLRKEYLSKLSTMNNAPDLIKAIKSGDGEQVVQHMLESTRPMFNMDEASVTSLTEELKNMDLEFEHDDSDNGV